MKGIKVWFSVTMALTAVPSVVLFTKIALLGTSSCSSSVLMASSVDIDHEKRDEVVVAAHAKTLPVAIDFNICDAEKNADLIVISIVTAPAHFERRQKIRSTWGSVKRHSGAEIVTIFFIGAVINVTLQEAIVLEARAHNDIVQDVSYIDTYRNLTSKSLSILRWTTSHCPNALSIIKVDDDTLVNPYNVISFLRSEKSSIVDKLVGVVISDAKPYRIPTNKWYVSFEEFKGTKYPSYCDGFAYMMPPSISKKLLEASEKLTSLPMEDVYLTGILREFIGATQFNLSPSLATSCRHVFKSFLDQLVATESFLFMGHAQSLLQYDVFWKVSAEIGHQN